MPYLPILELTRGGIVETVHFGAVAVVNSHGVLIASYGDPATETFMRSSAKPFQIMPFLLHGGQTAYGLTEREIAVICASHSGTDDHVATVRGIQAKTGVVESDLLCGTHLPSHKPTVEALRQRGESPTPNRHNCSGKHTGMVAHARLHGLPYDDYINPAHPIQQEIIQAFCEMCEVSPAQVTIGIDGCSAPNFAISLHHAALGFARLSDPARLTPDRAEVCQTIFRAMTANPEMVGGPDSFDTHLMQTAEGRILSKGGAEGYMGIGIAPGLLGDGSPGLGITFKISDGDLAPHIRSNDQHGTARPAIALEILRQLGILNSAVHTILAGYGPTFELRNWRKLLVGQARPCFELNHKR